MASIHSIRPSTVPSLMLCCALSAGPFGAQAASSSCSDVNGDEVIDLSDAVSLLNWLFAGGTSLRCREAQTRCGEVNGDGAVDLSDAVTILGWLFLGSDAPGCKTIDPPQLTGFTSLGLNEQGYAEYRHEGTGIMFVSLPGGTFWMGAQSEDPAGRNYDPHTSYPGTPLGGIAEGPVHEVTLSPFLIAKYEVTQRQWLSILGENPALFQPRGALARSLPRELLEEERWLDLPVDEIRDVVPFVEKTGLGIPTEAQWEYACRAGVEGPISGTGNLDDMGWHRGNNGDQEGNWHTSPVGTKAPNQFGLHDMHGNVWEWCEDQLDLNFYEKPEAAGPDPIATQCTRGFWQVVRGGAAMPTESSTMFEHSSAHRALPVFGMCCSYLVGVRPAVSLAGKLKLKAERLDFGAVVLGHSGVLRLEMQNLGTLPLEVRLLEIIGDGASAFQMPMEPVTIEGLGRAAVDVRYEPLSVGPNRATLVLETSNTTKPLVELRLLGQGLEPLQEREIQGFSLLGANAQGFPEYRHDLTGIVFVLLPGGRFWMGTQGANPDAPNFDPLGCQGDACNKTVHGATLSPFLIAKYELTQRQWLSVMEANPSCFQPAQGCIDQLPTDLLQEDRWLDLPVESVSWIDVQAFLQVVGLELPSEAQWEYACRAGVEGPVSGSGSVEEMSWYPGNANRPHVVGTKAGNQFGLHDTHGNVWEWCADLEDCLFYESPGAAGPDPVSTTGSEEYRVVRGCSFLQGPCGSAARYGSGLERGHHDLGVRPALRP